jgi:tetratricopeptide (TPR) repeat protein
MNRQQATGNRQQATVLGLVFVVACSAPAKPFELAMAEELERHDDDTKTLAAYEKATRICWKLKRRDRTRWCPRILIGHAQTLERLGRREDAARAYEWVALGATEGPDVGPEPAAIGLTEAARLHFALGHVEKAYSLAWAAIINYPEEFTTDVALRMLVKDGRARDPERLYLALVETYVRLEKTELADNLLAALADLAEKELRDPAGAIDVWDRLAERKDSSLRDEALWRAALLVRARKDPHGAIRRLRALLATQEHSYLVGSYDSVHLDDAQLLVGIILRDDLGEPRAALHEFALVERRFKATILGDDALWETAVTYEQLGEDQGRCRALRELEARFPDSRYLIGLQFVCPD